MGFALMDILLSPHNDDETLFASYTLIKNRPLVVVITDSYVQPLRGEIGCTAEERWRETLDAMAVLGCSVVRLGIRDDELTEELLAERLKGLGRATRVYAPALQGGHAHHDIVARVADRLFDKTVFYTTYTKQELWTKGDVEVVPTAQEIDLKNKALDCYTSQIKINKPHFDAVRNRSEWLSTTLNVK